MSEHNERPHEIEQPAGGQPELEEVPHAEERPEVRYGPDIFRKALEKIRQQELEEEQREHSVH